MIDKQMSRRHPSHHPLIYLGVHGLVSLYVFGLPVIAVYALYKFLF